MNAEGFFLAMEDKLDRDLGLVYIDQILSCFLIWAIDLYPLPIKIIINQLIIQSINQSINQSVSQSICPCLLCLPLVAKSNII